MKTNKSTMQTVRKAIPVLMALMFAGISLSIQCFHKKEKDNSTLYYGFMFFRYTWYSCSLPGALQIGDSAVGPFCRNNPIDTGLIYDQTTGTQITTSSISPGVKLECRCLGQSSLSSVDSRWYKSDIDNPPTGYRLSYLGKNEPIYDKYYSYIGVKPFESYASGDILFCFPSQNSDLPERTGCDYYQKLKVN